MNVRSLKYERLLETATGLAHRRGLHATSMSQIAKYSNVAVGTIYLRYPSKDALYTDLLRRFYTRLTACIILPDTTVDFVDQLQENYQRIHSALEEDEASFGLFQQLRQLKPYALKAETHQREFQASLSLLMEPGKRQVLLKNLSTRVLGVLFFEQICAQAALEFANPHELSLQSKDLLAQVAISSILK